MHQRSKQSRGFTLIELLAVVAIILLLLALLAPALQKARDRAYCVVCASNVWQVTMGILHFASDNDGYLPGPNWGTQDQFGWLSSISKWPNLTALQGSQLWKYLGSTRVFRCPADPQPKEDDPSFWMWPGNTRMVTSYNMNGSVCGYGGKGFVSATKSWNTYRVGEYKPSDIVYWEGDETTDQYGYWWDGGNFPWEGMSARHFSAGTVASVDGRVERMDTNTYYQMGTKSASGPNRLWNRPTSSNGG